MGVLIEKEEELNDECYTCNSVQFCHTTEHIMSQEKEEEEEVRYVLM